MRFLGSSAVWYAKLVKNLRQLIVVSFQHRKLLYLKIFLKLVIFVQTF